MINIYASSLRKKKKIYDLSKGKHTVFLNGSVNVNTINCHVDNNLDHFFLLKLIKIEWCRRLFDAKLN